MADISAWSPVDESNNQPPPAGWPEGMAPSAINNSARAVMGGVRRWYDIVTAQLASLTASLANYLPLTGGTITGNLTVTGVVNTARYNVSGVAFAERTSGGVHVIYDGDGAVALALSGTAGSQTNDYTADYHIFRNNAGGVAVSINNAGHLIAASMVSNSNIDAGSYLCDGVAVLNADGGNPLIHKAGGSWGIQLQSSETFYDNNNHTFRNAGSANTFTIDASGNVNATAQVQGSALYARGNIDAAGTVTANGNLYAIGGSVDGAYVRSRGDLRADGQFSAGGTVSAGGNLYATGSVDAAHVQSRGDASVAGVTTLNSINMSGALNTSNWIRPFVDHGCNICLPGANADSMHAYSFVVPSDARLKSDIATPTGCLELLQAIPPRTYCLPGAPDPDTVHWGLVAGEVKAALQGRAFGGYRQDPTSGEEGLAVNEMLALLWGAVRELAAKLEEANAR